MSTNFPGAVDDGITLPNPGANAPTNNPSLSGGQTNQNDAIKAIEAKVGTGASTPTAGKVFRGTGSGTSAWGALDVTTDLTGVLPVANGGTGLSVLTIPASAILVGTTDAQDVTNKTLHDTFMGETFMSQSPTFRNVLLDASVNYLITELLDIGAAFTLEIPATSTLEVRPFHGPQGFASAQHDHTGAAGGGVLTAPALAANAIFLASASTGGLYSSAATGATQLTGASITLTWPAGGRSGMIIFSASGAYTTGATGDINFSIWDGAVGTGTRLQDGHSSGLPLSNPNSCMFFYVFTPTAGTKTYNIGVQVNGGGGGTANVQSGSIIMALVI